MSNNIDIPNPESFEQKIQHLKREGAKQLHIVADFDRTLTKAFSEGKKVATTIAKIREGNYLSPEYVKKAYELFNIYHPIEVDLNISFEEKNVKMHEWWQKHFDLLIESGMNKGVIEDIITKKEMHMRPGALKFFDLAAQYQIPLLIFSAGPGDIITEYLKSEQKLTPNVHVIANIFVFDENGKAIGVQKPIIHSLNKSEIAVKDFPYHKQIEQRTNVLLLGDSLDDLGMLEGIVHHQVIKIGFLNEDVDKLLPAYKKAYDVVIINDGSMEYINTLLSRIIS
jgi:5'-nucleotidase